tara:strand:+ start:1170 stop:1337 length:168 start_codon:yes stop_codon:yes gene_type:complete
VQVDIESMKSTLMLYWDLKKQTALPNNENELFRFEFQQYIDQIEFKKNSFFVELT